MRSSKIYGVTKRSKKSSPGIHTNVFNVNISRNSIPETAPSTTSDTWDETVRQAYRVCKERVRMCQCTTKKKATRQKRVEEHRRWLQERLEKEDEWRHELAHSIASLSYFDANQDERSSVARSMSFFDTMDDYWSDEEVEEITNDILFRNDDMMEDIMDFRHHDGKSINPHAVLHRPSSVLCADGFTEIPKDCVGYPGLLTSDEYDAIMELKYRLDQQTDPMYWDMVRHFSDLEPEVFALCRFCRGRNFNAAEVIQMMSEHIEQWRYASVNNFFPDVEAETGVSVAALLSQYPFVYMGNSKKGFPVCYFNAAKVSIDGMLCIATMEQIQRIQWHMSTSFTRKQYKKWRDRDPDSFIPRLEQITIINLEGMSKNFFSKKNLSCLKTLNVVLESFPEMLYRCVVVNAPSFFSWAWHLIKRIIDEKTASRVVIFSDEIKAQKYLLDLIDEDELAADCGGKNEFTSDLIRKMADEKGNMTRQFSQLFDFDYAKLKKTTHRYIAHKELVYEFELIKSEMITITLYTRCPEGITFTLTRTQDGQIIKSMELVSPTTRTLRNQDVSNSVTTIKLDEDPEPYETKFITNFKLSGKYILKGVTGGENSSLPGQVLILGDVYQTV